MGTNADTSKDVKAEEWRTEVAARVAGELRRKGQEPRFAKVTSLSHAMRAPGMHSDFRDVVEALQRHGVSVSPPPEVVSRRDVLELGLEESPDEVPSARSVPGVRVSVWRPGRADRLEQPLSADASFETDADDVLWFDLEPMGEDTSPNALRDRAQLLTGLLRPWCLQIDELVVRDLLVPDTQPKVETYGDERTGVRKISVAAVIAREVADDDDDFDGADEQLILQVVELVVGPGWILTCWQPTHVFTGSEAANVAPPLLREPFLSHVAHRWVHADATEPGTLPKTSAHLGLYLARSLVATYGASLRLLQRWISNWEVTFYKSLSSDDKSAKLKEAASEVSNFLSMVGEFSRNVNAFKLAGEEMPNKTWFPDLRTPRQEPRPDPDLAAQAEALDSSVESAEQSLARLSAEIRADMDLLMIQSQATQQEYSERLQSYLGKVTGLILVPTFVAGLFGANTALPGGGSWTGFDLMLVLMVISGLASYLVIRKLIR